MIAADQPNCFPPEVIAAFSSKNDGTMLDPLAERHDSGVIANRRAFCEKNGVSYGDTVYQKIAYGNTQSYDAVTIVGSLQTTSYTPDVAGDALITTEKNVGLFLPVADCIATVIYDPVLQVLAVAHLGRHSTIANLASRCMEEFIARGSNPSDCIIWMSPSVKRASYLMQYFDHADEPLWQGRYDKMTDGYLLDLPGYNRAAFEHAGVSASRIVISPIDTVTNANYFSHSQGDASGRSALLAMMTT